MIELTYSFLTNYVRKITLSRVISLLFVTKSKIRCILRKLTDPLDNNELTTEQKTGNRN